MDKGKARRRADKKSHARSDAIKRESIEERNKHFSEQSADLSRCAKRKILMRCEGKKDGTSISVPKTKYPLHVIKERVDLYTEPIPEFNKNSHAYFDIGIKSPKKIQGYCDGGFEYRKTQTGAVNVDWPPLVEATESSFAKLRNDLILFDDVWFSDILSEEFEWLRLTNESQCITDDILIFLTIFIHNQLKYKNEFQDAFQKTLPVGDRIKKHLCSFAVRGQAMLDGRKIAELTLSVSRWDGVVCGMFGQLGQITRFANKFRNACQWFGNAKLKPGCSAQMMYDGKSDRDLWRWYRGKECKQSNFEMTRNFEKISLRCSTCLKTEDDCGGKKHLLCRICMNALYCSKKCQRFAWKTHKKVCNNEYILPRDVNVRKYGDELHFHFEEGDVC